MLQQEQWERRESKCADRANRQGLPRNTAGLQGTSEPLVADAPGDDGRLSRPLALETRRLDGGPDPATTADLHGEPLALRLEVNKANRDWTD